MTNKNKCIQIIVQFNTVEYKSCVQYMRSNSRSELYPNLIAIYKSKPNISDNDLMKALGSKEISGDYQRQMHSRLFVLLKAYIAQASISEENKKWKAVSALRKEKTREIYDAEIEKVNISNLGYQEALNATLSLCLDTNDAIQSKNIRSQEPQLQAIHDTLDHKYIFEKLKYSCASLNFALLNQYEYQYGLMDLMEDHLDKFISSNDVVLELYFNIYRLLKDKDDHRLKKIILLLKKNKEANEEIKLLYTYTINYVVVLINKGNRSMLTTLFELYQTQIFSRNIYDHKGEISPHGFKNILALSLNLKEYAWANHFIENHKNKLPSISREEHYMFGMARYHFEMKAYKKCAQSILLSKPMDLLNNLSLRILQIKALYMLEDYDGVDTAIDNCKLFILRHPSKSYLIQNFKNFIKIIKIINQKVLSKKDCEALKLKIESMKSIAEKEWLMGLLK